MLKRTLLIGTAVLFGAGVLILVWKPGAVKARLLTLAVRAVSRSTPYELHVGSVSGRFLSNLTFKDVRLIDKKSKEELLLAPTVHVGISGRALLHHHTLKIHHLECDMAEVRHLIFRDIRLKANATAQVVQIDPFQFRFDPARAKLKGKMSIDRDSQRLELSLRGRVADGTLRAAGVGTATLIERADVVWTRRPLASATLHVSQGIGDFHVNLSSGEVKAVLNGVVDLPHQRIRGNGKIEDLTLASLGLTLKDIDLDFRAVGKKIEIRHLTAKAQKGTITVTGGGVWPELNYTLQAREVVLRPNPKSKVATDTDLRVRGTWDAPVVTGQINLKEAAYTVPAKEKKKKPAASPPPLWPPLSLDIAARWPRDVWIRDGATNIETAGDLRIQKSKGSTQPALTGTIRSVRGTYNYYGRDFTIESGELHFVGDRENIPYLKAEASYRSDPTVVTLNVTGPINQPTLTLKSNPPLPQQDIISVIVFGRPLNQMHSRSGGQTANQEMMHAAGGVLGSYLAKQLRKTGVQELNFDVMNLQPTSQGSQLTVGKYVNRRLFISYGQAIRGSADKSVTADYFLTDKWTLQGATDSLEGNHMDVLFRYPLNNRDSRSNASPVPVSLFRNKLDTPPPQQSYQAR